MKCPFRRPPSHRRRSRSRTPAATERRRCTACPSAGPSCGCAPQLIGARRARRRRTPMAPCWTGGPASCDRRLCRGHTWNHSPEVFSVTSRRIPNPPSSVPRPKAFLAEASRCVSEATSSPWLAFTPLQHKQHRALRVPGFVVVEQPPRRRVVAAPYHAGVHHAEQAQLDIAVQQQEALPSGDCHHLRVRLQPVGQHHDRLLDHTAGHREQNRDAESSPLAHSGLREACRGSHVQPSGQGRQGPSGVRPPCPTSASRRSERRSVPSSKRLCSAEAQIERLRQPGEQRAAGAQRHRARPSI